jgi:hypothetical protein
VRRVGHIPLKIEPPRLGARGRERVIRFDGTHLAAPPANEVHSGPSNVRDSAALDHGHTLCEQCEELLEVVRGRRSFRK